MLRWRRLQRLVLLIAVVACEWRRRCLVAWRGARVGLRLGHQPARLRAGSAHDAQYRWAQLVHAVSLSYVGVEHRGRSESWRCTLPHGRHCLPHTRAAAPARAQDGLTGHANISASRACTPMGVLARGGEEGARARALAPATVACLNRQSDICQGCRPLACSLIFAGAPKWRG